MLQRRRVALPEAVHVEDGDEVVELVLGAEGERLPDGALRRLSVPDQAVHAVAETAAHAIQ